MATYRDCVNAADSESCALDVHEKFHVLQRAIVGQWLIDDALERLSGMYLVDAEQAREG